jgi:hypothetical protein
LTPLFVAAARIVACLSLGCVLLFVARDKAAPVADGLAKSSVSLAALLVSGDADHQDAACVKAPYRLQAPESNATKTEAEPDPPFGCPRAARPDLALWRPIRLSDASPAMRRSASLGRGPPRAT